jgi:hypothetical protein
MQKNEQFPNEETTEDGIMNNIMKMDGKSRAMLRHTMVMPKEIQKADAVIEKKENITKTQAWLRKNALNGGGFDPVGPEIAIYHDICLPLLDEKMEKNKEEKIPMTESWKGYMEFKIKTESESRLTRFFKTQATENDAKEYINERNKLREKILSEQ